MHSVNKRPSQKFTLLNVSESFRATYGGGGAAYLEDLCYLLAASGHRVGVLCPESNTQPPYDVRRTLEGPVTVFRVNIPYIVDVDPEGWGMGLLGWLRHQHMLSRAVASVVSEWRPQLVLLHLARPFGEDVFGSVSRRGIPIAHVLHDAWGLCMRLQLVRSPLDDVCRGPKLSKCLECMYTNFDGSHARGLFLLPWRLLKQGPLPLYRTWRRAVLRTVVSGTLAYSRFMHDLSKRYDVGLLEHVPLGINLSELSAERSSRPRNPLRFGFVAGFQPHKGVWHVLDAAAVLKQRGLRFELRIWGPGSAAQANREISVRGLEGTAHFHGVYSPSTRWQVYSDMDVAIMATTWVEPFGRVIGEAAASGATAIAPDIGGISEQIRHNHNGLLYRFRDSADLLRQMERILVEPGLFSHLARNLTPPPDTRQAIEAVEAFCLGLLSHGAKHPPAIPQRHS